MNKKPGLLFAVCLLAMIILAVSFGMNFGGNPPVHLPSRIDPSTVLYVCPAADSAWTHVSRSFSLINKYAHLLFFFAVFVLIFSWGWALYQNLLKDKFNDEAYKNSWELTKMIFWVAIVYTVLVWTPNHFRRVEVRGTSEQYVLCENTSTGAKATFSKNVTSR